MNKNITGNCPNCDGTVRETIGNPRAVGPNVHHNCEDCQMSLKGCDGCGEFPVALFITTISVPVTNYKDPEAGAETIHTCARCDPQSIRSFDKSDIQDQHRRTQTR